MSDVAEILAAMDAIAEMREHREANEQAARTAIDQAAAEGCGAFVDASTQPITVFASPFVPRGQGIVYRAKAQS